MWLFYAIWVDGIKKARMQPANKHNWKVMTLICMSLAMSSNFIVVMAVLQRNILKYNFYQLNVEILPEPIKNILGFMVLFYLPCVLLNYWLIFRNKKYNILLKRYKYYNGILFISYFFVSIFTPILFMWIGVFLSLI